MTNFEDWQKPEFMNEASSNDIVKIMIVFREDNYEIIGARMISDYYMSGVINMFSYSRMEKRGSKYLRYALINATKFVCFWDPTFAVYLAKKRAEGKHYNVAISHAAKNWLESFSI